MAHYDIDYKKLALLLMPVRLRRPRLASLVYVAVSQVQRAARLFGSFRASTDYRLAHNGQICRLRAVLNDKYDPVRRRILIEDIASLPESLLHLRSSGLFPVPRPAATLQPPSGKPNPTLPPNIAQTHHNRLPPPPPAVPLHRQSPRAAPRPAAAAKNISSNP